MVLRHGRNDYVLHDLAELRGQVRIQLTHGLNLHVGHAARLAHVADHDWLVAALMVQLRSGLLHQPLALSHGRRCFLS